VGKANGFKTGTVMWPIRIALSGWHLRPRRDEIAQVLGKAERSGGSRQHWHCWGTDHGSGAQGLRPADYDAGVVLTAFMGSALNVALPILGKQFSMDAVTLGWIATAYTLAIAIFWCPSAARRISMAPARFHCRLARVRRHHRTAGARAVGEVLIALRVLQALRRRPCCDQLGNPELGVPPGERGRVLGINVSAVYIGLSLGPFLGGFLTQNFGWRSIFWASALVGVVAAVAALRLTAEWAESKGERFDWVGAIIYGASIATAMYGLSRLPAWEGGVLIAAGLAGLVGFASWASRVSQPSST